MQIKPHLITSSQNKFYRIQKNRGFYRFIIAYWVDLGAKHDCSESEKQKTLKAQEDHQDHSYRWGEVTALCENEIRSYKKPNRKL